MEKNIKKTSNQEFKKNEDEKFRAVFENSLNAILLGNPDNGDILDANSAASEMFGYTVNELRKLNRNDIFNFTDSKMISALITREKNGSTKGELEGIRKNGERFPCEFSSVIFKNEFDENRTSTVLNDIGERKKSEQLLIDSEKRFRSIIEHGNDIILLTDETGYVIYASPALGKIIGYSLDDIKNKPYKFFVHPEDKKESSFVFEELLKKPGVPIHRTIRVLNKDANYITLEGIVTNLLHDENVRAIVSNFKDVTEKKLVLKELQENKVQLFDSHEQLIKLTDNVNTVIYQFEISPEGKMTFPFMSKSIDKIVPGINIELLKEDASSAFATVHPDDLRGLLASIEESRRNLSDWNLEYRSIAYKDKITWIKGSSHPNKKEDGTIVYYGYLLDITERKLSEEKIRESKERYDIIAKATNDTIWDRDLITDNVIWNKGIQGIFGYKVDEPGINDIGWWHSKIHPDDLQQVKKNLEVHINSKMLRWENEYRFLCEDNSYKYVFDRGFLVLDTNEVPIRMIGAMQDVTSRKLIEEKYRESEQRFKTIFESMPDCLKLVGINGELLEMNTAGLNILEVDSIEEAKLYSLIDFILPEYREAFNALHKHALDGKSGWMELEITGLKGTHKWLETNALPMHDGYGKVTMSLAVTRDITRRKQEEHHLKLLESVITNTNEAVVITEAEPFDEPGPRIVYVNKAFTKMTGYSENEVLGKSPRFLRGPKSDKNELNRLGEAIRKNQACEITTVNYKKNGEEFWINLNVSPIANEKGIITHWISIERDITQKKFYELEREQIIAELSQNNKDLKQFSYVTSHNLRAPIANLLGLSSLIDHYKIDNEELKHILDGVKQSAMMFDETVRELSQVLIIKDEINVTKENISVVAIINKTLTQLSIALDDNKVKVNYDLIKALTVTFSSSYLESIFINLFTNALKYKSNQHNLEINISSESTKEYDVVKFSDNGIGIDIETHREKLFKLYQQFHENSEGKGLGLYLVKSQMEALGGTVDVESEVGKGTTFILKFKKYPKE